MQLNELGHRGEYKIAQVLKGNNRIDCFTAEPWV